VNHDCEHDHDGQAGDDQPAVVTIDSPIGKQAGPVTRRPVTGAPGGA
jgi:hypothetical protein